MRSGWAERQGKPQMQRFVCSMLSKLCILMVLGQGCAFGQERGAGYPGKPVRILVGLAAGGGADVFMRDFAQRLAARWGQAVVVENRPGASGLVAMDVVANAAPDGLTLLGGTNSIITNMLLGKTNYDIRKAYSPVIRLSSQPYVLIANNLLPVNSTKDFLALAKAKPGSMSYASSGVGTASHLGMELMKYMSGADVVHVPYKGLAQAMPDLIGGRIQAMFSISLTAMPLIKSGKVKALGVTSLRRFRSLPDLPTLAESGVPNFSLSTDYLIYAPAGTPPDVVDTINKASALVMGSAEMRERLESEGSEVAPPNTPAEFKKSIEQDMAYLEKFIKASGFTSD